MILDINALVRVRSLRVCCSLPGGVEVVRAPPECVPRGGCNCAAAPAPVARRAGECGRATRMYTCGRRVAEK